MATGGRPRPTAFAPIARSLRAHGVHFALSINSSCRSKTCASLPLNAAANVSRRSTSTVALRCDGGALKGMNGWRGRTTFVHMAICSGEAGVRPAGNRVAAPECSVSEDAEKRIHFIRLVLFVIAPPGRRSSRSNVEAIGPNILASLESEIRKPVPFVGIGERESGEFGDFQLSPKWGTPHFSEISIDSNPDRGHTLAICTQTERVFLSRTQ